MSRPLDLVWVATKPPWPPIDGGRLVAWSTLRALAARGHRLRLVAPRDAVWRADDEAEERLAAVCEPLLVAAPARPRALDIVRAHLGRRPVSLVRHERAAVTAGVAASLASRRPDVVHAEQLQALAATGPALACGVPRVLRAQNVESDLWRALASRRSGPLRRLLRLEATRLARAEGRAVGAVEAAVALTGEDAARLEELAASSAASPGSSDRVAVRVDTVPAPFEPELPAGPPLDGDPAVVVFGSAGWPPNVDGARWFVDRVWPEVRRRAPGAVAHLFGFGALGAGVEGVRRHPAPADAATALARGSVLAVPLFVASGVRMKILEAWARGVPVVATPAAAAGLVAAPDDESAVTVADDPESFAAGLLALGCSLDERGLGGAVDGVGRRRQVAAGRAALAAHAGERVARELEAVYRRAAGLARWPRSMASLDSLVSGIVARPRAW